MRELLESCKSDFTTVSLDSSRMQSMVVSDIDVYNFDELQEKYFKQFKSNKPFASMDGLFVKEQEFYFIEFKNGKIDAKTRKNIKEKVLASLLTLMDIYQLNVEDVRNRVDFILVYSEDRCQYGKYLQKEEVQSTSSRTYIKENLMAKGHESLLLFGMNQYKMYFHKIHIISNSKLQTYLDERKRMLCKA